MIRNNLIQTLCAGVCLAILPGSAHAGTLALSGTDLISNTEQGTVDINLSFFAGSASYSGPQGSGVFGDGTVLDYRLIDSSDGTGYANGGGSRVPALTVPAVTDSGTSSAKLDVWTTTDPDGFTTVPDLDNKATAKNGNVSGDIDISGLVSGTVYVIHGMQGVQATVSATMTGAGQTDVTTDDHVYDPVGSGRLFYVTSFDFTNAADDYDTISFSYTGDLDATPGSRARFMGVAVAGVVPEPASGTMVLVGLGVLAVLRRRRD